MQKTFNFFYAFLLAILGFGVTLMAEDITLTTYYPAPYGAYDELTTTDNTYLATTSGNVGIGTTGPNYKLEVVRNVDNDIMSYAGTSSRLVFQSNTNSAVIYGLNRAGSAYQNISLRASANSGQLFLATSGNVGIGTTTPNYKLHVEGDINTTGDVRKNGSAYTNPDYVFEPSYNLMSITELKDYVFENKHLPNLPSADEIKKDGVKIFEQNRLLLEKLEEAYLHIFKLEERISKLESIVQKER